MKEQFRIGKLAEELGVERFVIRFWEKEFNIHSSRTSGGQRFYDQKNFDKFKLIKELLYDKGFTIAGAKKILNEGTKKTTTISPINKNSSNNYKDETHKLLLSKIVNLQKQLFKLKKLL